MVPRPFSLLNHPVRREASLYELKSDMWYQHSSPEACVGVPSYPAFGQWLRHDQEEWVLHRKLVGDARVTAYCLQMTCSTWQQPRRHHQRLPMAIIECRGRKTKPRPGWWVVDFSSTLKRPTCRFDNHLGASLRNIAVCTKRSFRSCFPLHPSLHWQRELAKEVLANRFWGQCCLQRRDARCEMRDAR